ncbi:MAG: low-specificity L-threonine aldolase [Negativicutes bacterium]
MNIIDLRSDTVTKPTPEMREAMYRAEVGDDVYGEDPTVTELEALGARMTGKEAGLFVTSGTMGNQVAVMTHTHRGDEIICEAEAHIFYSEVAGLAVLSGVQARTIPSIKGILSAETIEAAIRTEDIHQPSTALICLEDTHNRAGGTCYPLDTLAAIRKIADRRKIPVHIDGARLFNAAVAQGVSVDKITQYADTVQFCLSKGLCAPVGTIITGRSDFIAKARKYRKMLGGGMRQAGILAAAGIVGLTSMVDRLAEDHENARHLAEELASAGFAIDLSTVQTNIVMVDVSRMGVKAADFAAKLKKAGVLASVFGEYRIRMVTHHGITSVEIGTVVDTLNRLLKKG